jgi:uncharacterized damage-inducible protein DinB
MLPEPWLRGPIPEIHPLTAPILYAFQQAREDLAKHTAGLTAEQLWAQPHGFGSAGFHIRHIAGSTERLMAYLQNRELTPTQLDALRTEEANPTQNRDREGAGPTTREELLQLLDHTFEEAETVVRAIDPATLTEPRTVGRKKLLTTVIGLLTHIAEHTQRHVGQAISACKLARV